MKHAKTAPKVGRNAPCPCGSGRKYKKCCMGKSATDSFDADQVYAARHKLRIKTAKDVEGIRAAGQLVVETLQKAEAMIKPGITTEDINTMVHDLTLKRGAVPATLNYRGYPKSVCTSVNEVICHGIPGPRILEEGDIINVDVTPILNGYYADASITYFVGTPGQQAQKIVSVARHCLKMGLAAVKPGNRIGHIGWEIQTHAEAQGCSVVREFVGHGVGFDFHEPPQVPHYGHPGDGVRLIPGMVFTVEPMINLGAKDLKIMPDGWTAVTKDGSLSAQFEQTILVTEQGFESLTPFEL